MKTKTFILICICAIFTVNLSYARWPSVDPHAENYYPQSPYAFAGNNPINRIDPDGRDVWEINNQGEIINRIKDKTQDAFHIVQQVDGQWQRMEGQSIAFEYGTIVDARTPTVNLLDADGNVQQAQLTIFEVNGDKNASQLFEFMGNPGVTTNVEWSHVQVGTANSGRNIVGSTEGGVNYTAVNDYILQTGYTIRADNHSHVYNNIPSPADMRQAGRMNAKFPNATSSNYYKGSYTPYNAFGPIIPYPIIPGMGRRR